METPPPDTRSPQSPQITSIHPEQNGDVTPTRTSSSNPPIAHSLFHSEDLVNGTHVPAAQPLTSVHQRAASNPSSASREESPVAGQSRQRSETAPVVSQAGSENGTSSSGTSATTARNKDLARVTGQDAPATKRQRSPYVKWSKEEDDLLAQAVAKYGQKWDLVQKALPSRGYHQVRQRWLRKLGVFDSKPDLSSFQTAGFPAASRLAGDSGAPGASEPPPNPKLGLAPLSSEIAYSSLLSGRGESRPPMPS
ncbi:hypothetical protein HYDPIDRAFT_77723 [Hydnomerulius pinastri MD-312]|nr:hypothetical protein HYDPIDRAFT_77723 [Hydnomerulius pinastri MD-312]